MPGHEGIAGDETAYLLAITGSEHPFIGLEPACGISIRVAKRATRNWTNRNHTKQCESTTGLKQAKGLISGLSARRTYDKMDCRTIHRTMSSKWTPFKVRLTDVPTCERCLGGDESVAHILCDCEAMDHLRFRHRGQFFMKPSDF
jgi:hypothetical protein